MKKSLFVLASLLASGAFLCSSVFGWGSITGNVYDDATNEPLAGRYVHAYHQPGGQVVEWARTDSLGNYTIGELEQGVYYVWVHGGYDCASEWWENTPHPEQADPIEVRDGETVDHIDFGLACEADHGCIVGRVTDQRTGDPINDAYVRVYTDPLGDPVAHTYTGGDGYYEICELEEGIYFVHAHAQNCEGEWFDNKFHPENADTVEVRAGQITDGINFTLECQGGYGCIVGRVTDEGTGNPINDALVKVYTNPLGDPVAHAFTGWNGHYEICELEEGVYFVHAYAENCEGEWFDNQCCPGEADTVEVRAGQVTDHIDFALTCERPRGCIVGRVTDERTGDPIPHAYVAVFRHPHGERVAYAFTGENGFYEICKLEPGVYYAFAHTRYCDGEWYNNKRRPAEADPIEVHPGEVTDGINFTLPCERPRRGCIVGRVTDEGTGDPIPRAFVAVFKQGQRWPVAHTFTGENGFYEICRLEPGTYYAFAHARHCGSEWFRNKRRREHADPIRVHPGRVTRHIDFTLECEAENLCIWGRVVDDSTGEGINDAFVVAMMVGHPYARYAFSGENGHYEICGLTPGEYIVFAHADGYIGEYYDNVYRWEHATLVTPPEDHIDFSLGHRRHMNRAVTGKVFCGTGPASGAMVYAYESNIASSGGEPVSSALTEADGSYSLEGLSDGMYVITASRPGDPTTSYPELVRIEGDVVEGIDIHLGTTLVRAGAVGYADNRGVLLNAMPNPFRSKTYFSFTIPASSDVRLEIFDLSGRLVTTLLDENLPEGEYTAEWRAEGVPSGVYISRLSCGSASVVRKIVLAR